MAHDLYFRIVNPKSSEGRRLVVGRVVIGLAVVFAILLVAANTMMMSFRERTSEFGVLKTLGFDGVEVPLFNTDLDYAEWGRRLDDLGLERTAVTVRGEDDNPISPDAAVRTAGVDATRRVLDCCQTVGATHLTSRYTQRAFAVSCPATPPGLINMSDRDIARWVGMNYAGSHVRDQHARVRELKRRRRQLIAEEREKEITKTPFDLPGYH